MRPETFGLFSEWTGFRKTGFKFPRGGEGLRVEWGGGCPSRCHTTRDGVGLDGVGEPQSLFLVCVGSEVGRGKDENNKRKGISNQTQRGDSSGPPICTPGLRLFGVRTSGVTGVGSSYLGPENSFLTKSHLERIVVFGNFLKQISGPSICRSSSQTNSTYKTHR